MKEKIINDVIQAMMPHLNYHQIKKLNDVLVSSLCGVEIKNVVESNSKQDLIELFISAKRVEGLSEKSLHYYKKTIEAMNKVLDK